MNENVHTTDEIELRDLILIFWKRRWMVIGIPIIVAAIVFTIGKMAPPVYTSTAKISLGSFNYKLYNDPNSVQQLLTSQDVLKQVKEKIHLDNLSVDDLSNSIKITFVANTEIIQIDANNSDPMTAQKIVQGISQYFMSQSDQMYYEKRKPLEQLYATLQQQYKQVSDPVLLSEIGSRLNDVQTQLGNMQKASLIEQASLPNQPQSNRLVLKTAVAFVGGFMLSLFLALIMEYFSKNPLRLKEEKLS